MDAPSFKLLVLRTPVSEKLRAFFECLGFSFTQEQHSKGPSHYAGAMGDATLEIYPLKSGAPNTEIRLGFGVTNLENAVKALKSIVTIVVTEPSSTPWGTMAVVRDPDGRSVELYQKTEK